MTLKYSKNVLKYKNLEIEQGGNEIVSILISGTKLFLNMMLRQSERQGIGLKAKGPQEIHMGIL